MQLTIVAQNLGHGGLYDGDGNPQDPQRCRLWEQANGAHGELSEAPFLARAIRA